jgi:hypothetical protein
MGEAASSGFQAERMQALEPALNLSFFSFSIATYNKTPFILLLGAGTGARFRFYPTGENLGYSFPK